MKRLILALLLIPTFAYADIAILLRNGAVIHWPESNVSYLKEEESLCNGTVDRFCINEESILGIVIEEKDKLPNKALGEMDVDPLILPLSDASIKRAQAKSESMASAMMEGRSILPLPAGKRWWEQRGMRAYSNSSYLKVLGASAKGWSQGWNQWEDYKMRRDISDIKAKLNSQSSSLGGESFLNSRPIESVFGKEIEIRPKYDYDPSNRLRGNIDSSGYGTFRDSNLNRYEVRPRW